MPAVPREAVCVLTLLLSACGARSALDVPTGKSPTVPDAGRGDASTFDASDGAIFSTPDADAPDVQIASKCSAQSVTTLAATIGGATTEIALDGAYVYYQVDLFPYSGIWQVPKGGGSATLIASLSADVSAQGVQTFALDATTLTFGSISPGCEANGTTTVERVPKQGGTVVPVATLSGCYDGFLAGPNGSTFAIDTFLSAPFYSIAQNGTVTTISSQVPDYSSDMAWDGTNVYTTSRNGTFRLQGQAFQQLNATPNTFGVELALDGNQLFFSTADPNGSWVWSGSLDGGPPTQLDYSQFDALSSGLAVDATHLYVGNNLDGTVTRMNKDGSSQTVVGSSAAQEQVPAVAVDDDCVYWVGTQYGSLIPSHVYAAPK